MAFCGNCGANVQDGVKFCPSCGAESGGAPAQAQQSAQQTYTPPVYPGGAQPSADQDAQDNKTMAILAYILFFIPLLTGAHRNSEFAKFHTNQGTALAISAIIYSIAVSRLSAILVFIPVIGWILMLILPLFGFVFLVLCIIGIVNAMNGRMKPLPITGKITIIK